MPMPSDDYMSSANEKLCINFFNDLFDIDDLKRLIQDFDPLNVERRKLTKKHEIQNFNKSKENRELLYDILNLEKENDLNKLSDALYILVGPNFLYEIRGANPNDLNSKLFRYELLKKSIEKNRFNFENDVNETIKKVSGITLDSLEDIKTEKYKKLEVGTKDGSSDSGSSVIRWLPELLRLLSNGLPAETIERPLTSAKKPKEIDTITPIRELKPLHDYQIYAGKRILDTIQSKSDKNNRKRLLFSIPTGAGKTRLVCESLIDWINNDKKSQDENIHNSKYMIWIAQSRELCEQAISQFEEIYRKKGTSSLDIFRFYGGMNNTLESILSSPPKNYGLIVGTIDKFYDAIKNKPAIKSKNMDPESPEYAAAVERSGIHKLFYNDRAFGHLRGLTSCITVDEAHKGVTASYTAVLRGFGFNFALTSDENKLNEKGITLVGLTATAFRGAGLEKSQDAILTSPFMDEVTVTVSGQNQGRIKKDKTCVACKKILPTDEIINQSISNNNTFWHKTCEYYSSSTRTLYNRFSNPIIPNIHDFKENTKPKAIITCNEKFISNDPMRISGEKSYDPQGGSLKYSWIIQRMPDLTETFNIKNKINVDLNFTEKIFLIELNDPGKYKIKLTVENFDNEKHSDTKIITIIRKQNTEKSEDMQTLITNLINRDILSIVYHTKTNSTKYSVDGDTSASQQKDLLKKVAQNQERNQKIIDMIEYLLTKPKNKRKKILVFSCDIAHARLLAMWLKIIGISADYVDSKLSTSRNITKIKKFREKSGEEGQVLINTNMLTTGFDVPDVDCVIMGRPVMSTVEYTQMIGRGMRGTRMGGTKIVWLIDFDDQVQRTTEVADQVISLGWKSMAYKSDGTSLWQQLEENEVDENGEYLNLNNIVEVKENPENEYISEDHENDELELTKEDKSLYSRSSHDSIVNDTEGTPFLTASKPNTLEDPWIEFVNLEKTNPIALEFTKFIVANANGRSALDIETIIDLRKIVKRLLGYQSNMNNAQINLTYGNYDENTLDILKKMFQDVKDKLQKFGLIKFQTRTIIMILQPINEKQKIIKLCDSYIPSLDITKNISYEQELNKPKLSMEEQLKNEFRRLTYDVLGFIPDEDHFKKHVSPKLWEFLEQRHVTYYNWERSINFSEHQQRIEQRSQYLDIVIDLINERKLHPDRDVLESVIPDFDKTILENFFNVELFLVMVDDIFKSWKNVTKNSVNFTRLELDYENVKKLNKFEPKTEEILRYSKMGIGSYMKYSGNAKNFILISELDRNNKIPDTDYIARINLEHLKSKFYQIKNAIKRIPTEQELSEHSNYEKIFDYFWFNTYFDFLKFLGEKITDVENSSKKLKVTQSANDILKDDLAYLQKNGVRDLFDKILCEGQFKYEISFGSIEEYIKKLIPQNTQMNINIWNDKKKNFNPDDYPK